MDHAVARPSDARTHNVVSAPTDVWWVSIQSPCRERNLASASVYRQCWARGGPYHGDQALRLATPRETADGLVGRAHATGDPRSAAVRCRPARASASRT